MPRRNRHSDHEQQNHERWLISYSDFITLLFAFFVVMYSISSVNEGKYKVLSETLIGAFDMPEVSASTPEAIELNEYTRNSVIDLPETASKEGDVSSETAADGDAPGDQLNELSEQVGAAFADLIEDNQIAIDGNETWVEISLNSSLLFRSGSAYPVPEARPIITRIADLLAGYENPIHVEGFTDNVPINSELFPSNWELSAARSAAVVRMFSEMGVDPYRLAAVGYGEHQPVASNTTPDGRNQNRRVVLVVSRDLNVRRAVSGIGDENANAERELDLGVLDDDNSSFLKEIAMIIWTALLGGVALLLALGAFWKARSNDLRGQRNAELLEQRIDSLENELSALMDGSCGMGNQLHEIHRDLKGTIERQQQLEQREMGELPYNEAIRMVARGAGAEELMQGCGLSQSEADLVLLLHKASPPVVAS